MQGRRVAVPRSLGGAAGEICLWHNFFQVTHATLGDNTRELSTYLLLCLGYDLLWVKTKLSWLFAECKRRVLGNTRLQTDKVRAMGGFFVHLSVYSWASSKLRTQPCATCSDFEFGCRCRGGCALNGGLDSVHQRSLPSYVVVPSNLRYPVTLGLGPCCY